MLITMKKEDFMVLLDQLQSSATVTQLALEKLEGDKRELIRIVDRQAKEIARLNAMLEEQSRRIV